MSVPGVVLHGPESTGKSTLAAQLARHYRTVWVPEYGRTYCEEQGTDLKPADLVAIMVGHVAARQKLEPQARGLLIQDTDPIMTAARSLMLFGQRDATLDAFTGTGQLYLLMDIDLPWVGDEVRMFPAREDQRRFFDLCHDELIRRDLPYVLISGDGEARYARAAHAIEAAGLAPTRGRPGA